jgi:vancomycin permeability regulator SanA
MTLLDSTCPPPSTPTYYRVSRAARLRAAATSTSTAAAGVPRLALHAAARGVALFFGLFALLNLVGELRTPGFDQNIWWLDLRPLPASASAAVLGVAGALLLWWALRPAAPGWRRVLTAAVLAALAVVAVRNGLAFYDVWHAGLIDPWLGVPLSFVLAAVLLPLAWAAAAAAPASRGRHWTPLCTALTAVAALLACGVLFPLAQQAFFGKTTYVRPVEVAVVFGAQVHANGVASITLADRVATAVDLYERGLAGRLLMSGAQGSDEPVNETVVMRELAIEAGVPASAIAVDPSGFNTDATVRDTLPMLRDGEARAMAVVSDFFHLPRIKLAYQRVGVDVVTVPSHARRIPQTTGLVVREIPAFWVYYLRAVL